MFMRHADVTRLLGKLDTAVDALRSCVTRFTAVETHLSGQLSDQRVMLEWLRDAFTETKMSLVGMTHDRNQERERLLNVQRDFDWARLRINQLEAERATLLARVMNPTVITTHFAAPELQPSPSVRPEKGTELDAQLRELFGGTLFEDARDADDDGDDGPPATQ